MYGKSRYTKSNSRHDRGHRSKRFLINLIFSILAISALVGFWYLTQADFLKIKEVVVVGNERVNKDRLTALTFDLISGRRFKILPNNNLLFINEEDLSTNVLDAIKEIETLKIKVSWKGVITLTVIERLPKLVWCSEGDLDCYLVSADGFAFASTIWGESDHLVLESERQYSLYNQVATTKEVGSYLSLQEILARVSIKLDRVRVESTQKIALKTSIGEIFLNPSDDLLLAVQNALLLIEEVRAKNPVARFEYVDARFGNKVFYKLR